MEVDLLRCGCWREGREQLVMKFDLDNYVALGPLTETEVPKWEDSKDWCC